MEKKAKTRTAPKVRPYSKNEQTSFAVAIVSLHEAGAQLRQLNLKGTKEIKNADRVRKAMASCVRILSSLTPSDYVGDVLAYRLGEIATLNQLREKAKQRGMRK